MDQDSDLKTVLYYHNETSRYEGCLRSRFDPVVIEADRMGTLVNSIHPSNRLSPLLSAVLRGDDKSARFFLEEGADMATVLSEDSLFNYLFRMNRYDMIRLLLEQGCLNSDSFVKKLKLSSWITNATAESDCPEFLRWLFAQRGLNLAQKVTVHDPTVLHAAVEMNAMSFLELLLPFIDPNMANERGQTPLMHSCLEENLPMLQLLLSHPNIDINATDKMGNTALMLCVRWDKPHALRVLLGKSGHDMALMNNHDGETLLQLTERVAMRCKYTYFGKI